MRVGRVGGLYGGSVFTTWLLWINRLGTFEVFSIKSQSRLLLQHDSQLYVNISQWPSTISKCPVRKEMV